MLELLYSNKIYQAPELFSVITVKGPDSFDFLNRQLTSDISKLKQNKFSLSSRLDRNGRLHSFFYLLKENENSFKILCDSSLHKEIHAELNKFLIMEDVELLESNEVANLYYSIASTSQIKSGFSGTYLDLPAVFTIDTKLDYKENNELYDFLVTMTAWPILNKTVVLNTLVNETRLNELAVSYKKGCYLGQETISKIETRRGAARYPAWLTTSKVVEDEIKIDNTKIEILSSQILNGKLYYLVNLNRKFRVNELDLEGYTVLLNSPLGDIVGPKQSTDIYHRAIELFHKNNIKEAIELLDIAIYLDPECGDFYESKGAILGQSGKFEDAIEQMNKLLCVDPDSVMAHTNKSLYLMKLGKIEEAEEEKSLATVASFKQLGKDAKAKKELQNIQEVETQELIKREAMFKQVLEIDEEDDIANFGMADILYKKKSYIDSLKYIEVVLRVKPKYSQAYLLKGKNLESINKQKDAIEIYKVGVKIAADAGELMPANEMQSRLSKLLN